MLFENVFLGGTCLKCFFGEEVHIDMEDELDLNRRIYILIRKKGGNEDKSGFVEQKKLVQVVKDEFGMTIKIDRLVEVLDKDKDGKLSYEEFAALFI